jgi:hypothetical protein
VIRREPRDGSFAFKIGGTFFDPIIKLSDSVLSPREKCFLVFVISLVATNPKSGSNCSGNSRNTARSDTETVICHTTRETKLSLNLIKAVHLVRIDIVLLIVIFIPTLALLREGLGDSVGSVAEKITIERKNAGRLFEIDDV